jgi:hypothetical protein
VGKDKDQALVAADKKLWALWESLCQHLRPEGGDQTFWVIGTSTGGHRIHHGLVPPRQAGDTFAVLYHRGHCAGGVAPDPGDEATFAAGCQAVWGARETALRSAGF